MRGGGLPLHLYRVATSLFGPLAKPYLQRRLRRGKEDAARLGERLGHPGHTRPPGPLVWVHGASVGESLALLPLVERLVGRGLAVLVTTGTLTSARILEQRLPAGAFHQFVPLDVPAGVRRFLDHWRPQVAMLAESELWPNLVMEVTDRAIPLMLVNARLSERSFRRWRRLPGFIGAMLGRTALCMTQTDADARRLTALGASRVVVTGNLKFDGPPPPAEAVGIADLSARIGNRPVWVAASIHADEEATVLQAHARLAADLPGLLTIAVPRQVERGPAIAEAAGRLGLTAGLRSRGGTLEAATQVYVADTMGELGLFYRTAGVVFVGKSLGGGGGQNPIEPAKLGSAVLHGGRVANFAEVYRLLDEAGGALEVVDGDALTTALRRLLADPAAVQAMARQATALVARQAGATDRILAALEPTLARVLAASGPA